MHTHLNGPLKPEHLAADLHYRKPFDQIIDKHAMLVEEIHAWRTSREGSNRLRMLAEMARPSLDELETIAILGLVRAAESDQSPEAARRASNNLLDYINAARSEADSKPGDPRVSSAPAPHTQHASHQSRSVPGPGDSNPRVSSTPDMQQDNPRIPSGEDESTSPEAMGFSEAEIPADCVHNANTMTFKRMPQSDPQSSTQSPFATGIQFWSWCCTTIAAIALVICGRCARAFKACCNFTMTYRRTMRHATPHNSTCVLSRLIEVATHWSPRLSPSTTSLGIEELFARISASLNPMAPSWMRSRADACLLGGGRACAHG